MTKEEIQDLYLLLKSGNDVPVDRVTLPAATLKNLLDDCSEQAEEVERLKAENEHYEMASSGYCLNGCESPVFLLRLDRANQRIEALLIAIDRYRQKLLHTGNKDSLTLKNAMDADEAAAARRDYK